MTLSLRYSDSRSRTDAADVTDVQSVAGTEACPGRQPLLSVLGEDLPIPLVNGDRLPYANLDCAASAPALRVVADRVNELLPYYSSVHRGAGYSSALCTELFEQARATVAEFVGARPDDVTVFCRNTTDALNLLARAVPGPVLFLDLEHHANLLPWQGVEHRCVLAGTTQRATLVGLRAELEARPAALVAITGASNVTGELLPIAEIARLAHAYDARVVVDAAQLAPHRRIDIAAWDVDYLAFSGHKLYAPYGSGVLVGRRDWLDAAPPYLAGGGAVREVGVAETVWADAPQRHEGGTPNLVGAFALARACEALAEVGEDALRTHEDELRNRLLQRCTEPGSPLADAVRVHRIWRDSPDAIGVIAFSVDGFEPGLVSAYLSAEHGIGLRDGRFCAHPLLSRLNGGRDALRAGFGIGTTTEQIDRLADGLERLLTEGPDWTYAKVDGRYVPTPDPRPLPTVFADTLQHRIVAAGDSPCQGS